MLVGPDDSAVGSVSGGCVESAVYALAQAVVSEWLSGVAALRRRRQRRVRGRPDLRRDSGRLRREGVAQTFPELADIAADIQAGRPVAVATVVEHPDAVRVGMRMIVRPAEDSPIIGSMGSPRADAAVADDVRGLLAAGKTELLTYGPDGQRRGEGMRVFAASYAPPPRMLVLARSTSQRPSPGSAVSWDIG
jgi:xanthine dehydrogenase accessory factor